MYEKKDQVTIDGEIYVKKLKKSKMTECFNFKLETKIMKCLSGKFHALDECISEEDALTRENCSIMDPANVMLIIAKTDKAKSVLRRFILLDSPNHNPQINYEEHPPGYTKFSMNYLNWIISFFNIQVESVKINLSKDHPISVESDDWKVILAPRSDA